MESYFQEVGGYSEITWSSRSSESDDSERLVIVDDDPEDIGGPQASGSVQNNPKRMNYTYEELKQICIGEFILKKLTYNKLKRLMSLYLEEISEKNILCRRRCHTSSKTAKLMFKTLLMFHLMFEEIKETTTQCCIFYQHMSDLISFYIDFEIKASEVSAESAGTLSGRLTFIMEKCLDNQHRFLLDTLLKSHNICKKFQEISNLLISRVVRYLPSTEDSEQSFVRSMLVFKLWIQITNDAEEREKIFRLASHKAKPPEELMKEPSELVKEILPCNFRKCYIELTTYIIGTPWPLRKKIKKFLDHTRIAETRHCKESIIKSPSAAEEPNNGESEDIRALKEIQVGLQKIILMEKRNKKVIGIWKNNHFKYGPIEEIERAPYFLDFMKASKKDISTQTVTEQNEEFPFSHTKVIQECINELFKRMVGDVNIISAQNQAREGIDLQHAKIVNDISVTVTPNDARNEEFPQGSVPKEVSDLLNLDSIEADRIKTLMSACGSIGNIQNKSTQIMDINSNDKNKCNKKIMADEIVSTISVKPAASISCNIQNLSPKAVTDWHTPEIHSQSQVQSYKPNILPYDTNMTSGFIDKEKPQISQTGAEHSSMVSTISLPEETSSNINNETSNTQVNLVRSTESLLPTNSCLPSSHCNQTESIIEHSSPSASLNRQMIIRSSRISDTDPGVREDKLLVKNTSLKYFPPKSKNNLNTGPYHQVPGLNQGGCAKDQNHQMQQHPMLINEYNNRPHHSQVSGSFSFYDDDTIANSSSQILGSGCPNSINNNSLADKGFQIQPFNLPPANTQQPVSRPTPTRRRGRGGRNTLTIQPSYRNLSVDKPQNKITILPKLPFPDNQLMQNWPHISPQEQYNAFRNHATESNIPNPYSQMMVRCPAQNPNVIQNDPKLSFTRLPPYSSIRQKNCGFDPTIMNAESSSSSLPYNTAANSLTLANAPIGRPGVSSQPFPTFINNPNNLPVMNTFLSPPHKNVSLRELQPVTSASTSSQVLRTSGPNSEELMPHDYYKIYDKDAITYPLDLYNKLFNSALQKAMFMLTQKNDFGFLEYNFQKMPIPSNAFKEALTCFDNIYCNEHLIDEIVSLLSQTNANFVSQKNLFPPQLLKVNSDDIHKGRLNVPQEQIRHHEATLSNDELAFFYQLQLRNLYSECDIGSSHGGFAFKFDAQSRCCCTQCCANKIVLDVNHMILCHFKNYQLSRLSVHSNRNQQNQPLRPNYGGPSKRSIENIDTERDSPLPLKKRITSTPPYEARFTKDNEVSYPSTPMISIAELELLKDVSTNMIEDKTDSVNGSTSNISNMNPNNIAESNSSENSKHIFNSDTLHSLGSKELKIMPVHDFDNLSQVTIGENLSTTESIHNSVAIQPKSACKKSAGRSRKNAKKDP